jgi:hypothetical protein
MHSTSIYVYIHVHTQTHTPTHPPTPTHTHTQFIYTYIHNLPDVPHISWQDHIPDMLRSHVTFRLEPMTASDVVMAKIKGVLNRRCCGKATVALLRRFRTKQVSEFGSVAMGWMGHTYDQGNIYI